MSQDDSHYGSAGWAVFTMGVVAVLHAALVRYLGVGKAFITPIDETAIGAILLVVGLLMVRRAHSGTDGSHGE